MMSKNASPISDPVQKIIDARHHDPFEVLGRHDESGDMVVRAYLPNTREAMIEDTGAKLQRIEYTDLFFWRGQATNLPEHYRLRRIDHGGREITRHDPYTFPPQIPDYDLYLFGQGDHWHIHRLLGANPWCVDHVEGVLFATWAPNAGRVSVVGDFNHWDGRAHPMRVRGDTGVWELFLPGVRAGDLYKFEVRNLASGAIAVKADPYGKHFEMRPGNASVVFGATEHAWSDHAWMEQRKHSDWLHQPLSIYEVHLASWRHGPNGGFKNYRQLAEELVAYILPLGFTHIELLPITEHPYDASWGYQALGYFAPTSRYGTPDDFRYFVDYCHRHGVGVFLDWVPAHFPTDAHGLARFDGTALYEHEDPRVGEHRDWGTYVFNYGRNEVRNFLLASALYWLEEFHLDGLRVDAVASMLYLDYSRKEGEWLPNKYGGRENLEAVDFLRQLNEVTHAQQPGTLIMAEESTSWPQVSRPTWLGGLGFSMKWNMGWMHDTLAYMSTDPIYRLYNHDNLTFGMLYAYTENFILPFSHDEVVHGKGSLRYKMPGDEWQQFAGLRLLYAYMLTYPGKKLLFMGCEFGQGTEWNHAAELDWYVLQFPYHQGVLKLVGDLNSLYRSHSALHRFDFDVKGFEWIDCHDTTQSVLSYVRRDGDRVVIVVLNFTPMVRQGYRLGVPYDCNYREILNSDSEIYGGSNKGNGGLVRAEAIPWMNRPYSVELTIPPLGAIILEPA